MKGHTNAPHSHGAVSVSGVFYIDDGSVSDDLFALDNDEDGGGKEGGDDYSSSTTTAGTSTPLRIRTPAVGADGYPLTSDWSGTGTDAEADDHADDVDSEGEEPNLVDVVGSGQSGILLLWPG